MATEVGTHRLYLLGWSYRILHQLQLPRVTQPQVNDLSACFYLPKYPPSSEDFQLE